MGKKGMSADDKRKGMLEYFYETKAVYRLKDLENALPKAKGIVSMTVKDILQQLIDDNLVDSDKIGSGNFFWSLPSKATRTRQNRIDKLNEQIKEVNEQKSSLLSQKRKLEVGREPSEERATKLAKIADLRSKLDTLGTELKKFAACDPEVIEAIEKAIGTSVAAANRWTDNLYAIISYFKKMRSDCTDAQLSECFDLPKELEYVE